MKLSIVIISYNSLSFLKPCLASLKETLRDPAQAELIIVDNGSEDGTAQFINQEYPEVRFLPLQKNKGISFARNRGIEKASGDYILLLDSDTIANKTAIDGMLDYMNQHPETGICGCQLVSTENNVQDSCKPYPSLTYKANNLLSSLYLKMGWKRAALKKAAENEKFNYGDLSSLPEPFSPVYLIGACQMIRKEVIARIGLLDEHIFFGPEDADFCIRTRNAGWNIIYLPHLRIIHHWQRATTKKIFSGLMFRHFCALIYFYGKYKNISGKDMDLSDKIKS
ncbi:MAG: glycosyltransferase family 2 protein [Candidatus Azobacteroides sp.]|nr:glycosyltransferase family 2 protein [Candidatus Azobacteroides sp.]